MHMDAAGSNLLSLIWRPDTNTLDVLDQRALPHTIHYIPVRTIQQMREMIQTMAVRGAPAIGVAAAWGVYLGALETEEGEGFLQRLCEKAERLAAARPTAVNLMWAVRRMLARAASLTEGGAKAIRAALRDEAAAIHREDEAICRAIGEALLPKLRAGMGVLTHCNAGQLATSRYGTALSPIYLAKERGIPLRVYADETRPRLQGSMLTALELQTAGVDVTVICDNMAAQMMAKGLIDVCIVGCDRVARNGDTANKIGTLGVAVLAKHYGIPFYVAAPTPTIDTACPDGDAIPIEERDAGEVACRFGERTVPQGVKVINPAFDVTPAALIGGFATERGMLSPPFDW